MNAKKSPDLKVGSQTRANANKQNYLSTFAGINKHRFFKLAQNIEFLSKYLFKYDIYTYMRIANDTVTVFIGTGKSKQIGRTPRCRTYISPFDKDEVGYLEQLEEHKDDWIDYGLWECEEYLNGIVEEILRKEKK